MSTKFILGPEAIKNFLDNKAKNGELPDDLPEGPFQANVALDAPAPDGEVIGLKLVTINGDVVYCMKSKPNLPDAFTSSLAGEVLMRGKDYSEVDTFVLFREDDGEITAVFPFEPRARDHMACYAHVGQHGSCSMEWLKETKPATPEEYQSLKSELERAPYYYKFEVLEGLEAIGFEEKPVLAPR